MKLTKLWLIAFTLLSTFIYAQKVDYGRPFEIESRGFGPDVRFEDDRQIYAINYYSPDILIKIYDKKKLNLKKDFFVEIPELSKVRESIERIGFVGDKLVLFMELDYYKDDMFKPVAYIIDPEKGRIEDQMLIMEKPYDRSREKGYYQVKISENRKNVVVNTATYYDDRNVTEQTLLLLDENLKEVTRREFSEIGEDLEVSTRTLIDNEGTIYYLHDNELVMLDPFNEFEEWREKLPLQDLAVNGVLKRVRLATQPGGNLIITGFYETTDAEDQDDANKSRQDRREGDKQIEGVKCFIFDPLNQEFVAEKLTLFDQDFLDIFRDDDDKHDRHDGEINQDFNDIRLHFDEAGNTYLIGQPYWVHRSYDQNGNVTAEYFNMEELIVLAFDTDAELIWKDRIPKYQTYYWSGFFGFVNGSHGTTFFVKPDGIIDFFDFKSFITDGKLVLVYNDMLINRAGKDQNQELEVYKKVKKGNPVVQEIDLKTGRRDGKVVPKLAKEKMYLKPNLIYYSEMDQKFYYFLAYKKMMQLCTFTI